MFEFRLPVADAVSVATKTVVYYVTVHITVINNFELDDFDFNGRKSNNAHLRVWDADKNSHLDDEQRKEGRRSLVRCLGC